MKIKEIKKSMVSANRIVLLLKGCRQSVVIYLHH